MHNLAVLDDKISIQAGSEFKQHRLYYQNINLIPLYDNLGQRAVPFNVDIPSPYSQDYDEYIRKSFETAVYMQSKFEANFLIFNVGLRFDAFNPDGRVLADPTDPDIRQPLKPGNQFFDYNGNGVLDTDQGERVKTIADRAAYWYKKASVIYQLSTRMGLAFPISAAGVVHFSYGHFFQLPSYDYYIRIRISNSELAPAIRVSSEMQI